MNKGVIAACAAMTAGSAALCGLMPSMARAQVSSGGHAPVFQNGQWKAEIATDRTQYNGGRAVIISMTLTNVSARRHTVNTRDRAYDVVIRDTRTGSVIWSSARSRPAPPSGIDLMPDASQTYREIWDRTSDAGKAVPAGVYTVEARIGPNPTVATQVYLAAAQGGGSGGQNGGGNGEPINPPPINNEGGGNGNSTGNGGLSALIGTLSPNTARVSPGTRLVLTYTVGNPTAQPITARFSSGQQFDMVVTNAATQAEVWRASAGMMYIMSLTAATLGAGRTKSYTGTWNLPATLPPGRYRVTAGLTPRGDGPRSRATAAAAVGVIEVAAATASR